MPWEAYQGNVGTYSQVDHSKKRTSSKSIFHPGYFRVRATQIVKTSTLHFSLDTLDRRVIQSIRHRTFFGEFFYQYNFDQKSCTADN